MDDKWNWTKAPEMPKEIGWYLLEIQLDDILGKRKTFTTDYCMEEGLSMYSQDSMVIRWIKIND